MKKVMYLFSFLAFMTASNLNAQSNICSKICPPGSCVLNCDISECTSAQKATCQAKASQVNHDSKTPKATPANLVMEQKTEKPTTACCSLFESNKSSTCKKENTKASKVAYQAESTTKLSCCDWPCCPAKPAASKKMACGSSMK